MYFRACFKKHKKHKNWCKYDYLAKNSHMYHTVAFLSLKNWKNDIALHSRFPASFDPDEKCIQLTSPCFTIEKLDFLCFCSYFWRSRYHGRLWSLGMECLVILFGDLWQRNFNEDQKFLTGGQGPNVGLWHANGPKRNVLSSRFSMWRYFIPWDGIYEYTELDNCGPAKRNHPIWQPTTTYNEEMKQWYNRMRRNLDCRAILPIFLNLCRECRYLNFRAKYFEKIGR